MSERPPDDPVPRGPDEESPGVDAYPDGGSDEPDARELTGSGHDPTGLDLARTVAAALGTRPTARRRRSVRSPAADPQVSGAHPDGRDPKRLGEAMDRLVEARGWAAEVSVHTLLARWPALVGAANAAHSAPESYVDTVLTVRAASTTWATSLRTIAPQLVAVLNDQLGQGTVTRVRVLGPAGPTWKKGRLAVRDGRGPRDTYG